MGVPAMALVWPSVLLMLKSAWGVKGSVSVAELSVILLSTAPNAALMLAVLLKVPLAVLLMLPRATNVAAAPLSRFNVVLMFPLPLEDPQLEPPGVEQDQFMPVSTAAKLSTT